MPGANVETVVLVLVLATAFGLWRRAVDGRMRDVQTEPDPAGVPSSDPVGDVARYGAAAADPAVAHHDENPASHVTTEEIGAPLAQVATLVQFSSAFCQPCRATRQTLGDVAGMVDGVGHVEIDAEHHLDLVRRLHILRTPTVLIVDAHGAIRKRASGQPRKADVIAAIGPLADEVAAGAQPYVRSADPTSRTRGAVGNEL